MKPAKAQVRASAPSVAWQASAPAPVAIGSTSPVLPKRTETPITIVDTPLGRKVNSSPVHTKSTDIRSFFGGAISKGKENRNPVASVKGKEKERELPKPEKKAPIVKAQKSVVKVEKAKPEKKKRKVEEEDDDFVVDDEKDDVLDDDFESVADDEDGDVVEGDDDLESDHESADEKPSNAKKGYNGGWGGGGGKTTVKKKAPVAL